MVTFEKILRHLIWASSLWFWYFQEKVERLLVSKRKLFVSSGGLIGTSGLASTNLLEMTVDSSICSTVLYSSPLLGDALLIGVKERFGFQQQANQCQYSNEKSKKIRIEAGWAKLALSFFLVKILEYN